MNQQSYIVGRRYDVPCVTYSSGTFRGMKIVPIIGPLHEDAEIIKFKEHHWHIDWRFVRQHSFVNLCRNLFNTPHAIVISKINTEGPITFHRMVFKRAMPEFPKVAWSEELEKAFEAQTLRPGLICPHKGVPLAGCPVKEGVVVCPGHGLAWHVESGRMERRV